MKDHFVTLGIRRSAAPDEEEIQFRFKEESREAHPDAGGDPERFAMLNEARNHLLDPALRLRHWLALEFGEDKGGEMRLSHEIAELFQRTAHLLQRASALSKKREEAQSSLARSLLVKPMIAIQHELLALNGELIQQSKEHVAEIPKLDALRNSDPHAAEEQASRIAQELGFLGKWQSQLQEKLGEFANMT